MPSPSVLFVGSKAFGLSMLRQIHHVHPVSAIVHANDIGNPMSAFDDFKRWAGIAKVPIQIEGVWPEADYTLVCGWYRIIKNPINCFGIHHGPLPKYRGGAPLVWQIINGEKRIGTTLFELAAGVDDGRIVTQFSIPRNGENVGQILKRLEFEWQRELTQAWKQILAGTAEMVEQDHSQATTFPQRKPADGRIDWFMPTEQLNDFIKAQTKPYPGAWFEMYGRKFTVWDGLVEPQNYNTKMEFAEASHLGTEWVEKCTPEGEYIKYWRDHWAKEARK